MTKNSKGKLDPEIEQLLKKAQEIGAPEFYTLTPIKAREQYDAALKLLAGTPPKIASSEDLTIETKQTILPARLYRPLRSGETALPILVYFHGGGWSFGSINSHDHVCRWLCHASNFLVLSVDYRLAPEHKFPTAVDDAIAAVDWVSTNCHKLGADPTNLCVGGDSAGANLATITALHARDHGGPEIAQQLLIYPATDMSMVYKSHSKLADEYRLTRPLMLWSCLNYLRDGNDILNPFASPILAQNHKNLPPTILITAGFDPLHDEGKAYAKKLQTDHVRVKYRCYEGAIHGFIGMSGVAKIARDALMFCGQSLRD